MNKPRERMGHTLLVAYVSMGLGQVANQLFFFAVLRYLPVAEVGLYNWVNAIATMYTYLLDLGLGAFLVAELSETKYSLSSVVRLILLTRIPVAVLAVVFLFAWGIPAHASAREMWVLGMMGLVYIIQMIDVGLVAWLQVHQRQNEANLIGIIVPLARLLVALGILAIGITLSLEIIIGISLGTQILGTAFLWAWVRMRARSRDAVLASPQGAPQLLRRFFQRGPKLALMYSFNILQARLDWLLVAAMVSSVALANYSVANKILELALLLAGVWARTAFPWWTRPDRDREGLAKLALLRRLFLMGSGLLGVMLFFGAPFTLHFLFGDKYSMADSALRPLLAATVIFMFNQYHFYALLARKLEKANTVLLIAATTVQVALDLFFLPRVGILGAAVGMLGSALVTHLGQLFLLHRMGELSIAEIASQEIFMASAIAMLGFAWWSEAGLLSGIVLATAGVVVIGFFTVVTRADAQGLWASALSWRRSFRPKSA